MGKVYRRRRRPAMILSDSAKKIGWLTETKSGIYRSPVNNSGMP
jgi:hypothetical protein